MTPLSFASFRDRLETASGFHSSQCKLVERIIGAKHGTGGSAGVEFLKRSLFRPLFEDLRAVRHRM